MPDRLHSAGTQDTNAQTIAAATPEHRAQVATLDGAPATADFQRAADAVGLDGSVLSAGLAQLMAVPVLPEPVSGERAVIPVSVTLPAVGNGGNPQLLLAALSGLSLSDLMNLSVNSSIGLLEELNGIRAGSPINPFAAEFLHNMLSLPLPDLMSVGPLQNLILTDYAHHPGNFDFVWDTDPAQPAGALRTPDAPPTDHHPEQPVVGVGTLPVLPPPALFTTAGDTVVFDSMIPGRFAGGNLHDALSGNDYVVLPSGAAVAAALGYDSGQAFSGGSGNDTIVAGGLADTIDGGSGIDAVSYANSGPIVVLLQDTDTHGPHANEPAGASGGYAAGDSYTSIETLIASEFGDYVFGSAAGGTVYLAGGNDEFDNTETQVVADYVDGGAGNDTLWGGDGTDTLLGGVDNDALNGERGADRLDGGSGTDTLNGGDGDDLLDGGAGTDRLSGGNGDDTLIWRDADALLSGGAGTDTLRIASGDLDLGTLAGIASSIERLDLATDSSANGVTLSAVDVLGLSATDILAVAGTAADSINAGTGWTDAGPDGFGNHVYTKLSGGSLATLVVDQDVTVNADITA